MLRLLEIVSLAGAEPVNFEPGLSITPEDLAEAEHEVPEDGRPLVVVSPGSRDPRRRWPAKKFAAVADRLAEKGARIIINGDSGDRAAAEETLSEMKRDAQNVCGSLSLNGLAGLLSRAKLLVSNDSGPFHVASAVNTRSVAIFWCGNVLTYGPVCWHRTALHISWRTNCPRCGAHCMYPGCGHTDSFVAEISAEEVMGSALELFQEREAIHA
jgi:ADP-heptose:LPS heptosyltransferase